MNGANSEENSAAHGTNTEERWEIDQLLHHARLSQYIPVFKGNLRSKIKLSSHERA